ncbi:protein tyrosine kinase [Allochromatium vinosum]|uniref:non-specific protein-tyrosine kinase n=2 Tax=Allochromatium vinosum TaxID=1049 RepID=D3RU55_ALLVD|nr:protein-tyrosine kinase [Allochromatium vinosum DSM 180]MBK1656120.1 protein tyrosine kinase [Allochromatium vinosum]
MDEAAIDSVSPSSMDADLDIPTAEGRFHRLALDQLRLMGLLTPDAKRSQIAEEYRLIKRPLIMNIDKKGADIVDNANLIMVTSALTGEGKTFSAINLAISIAMERDRTVLLVDGDVAKPSAAKRLGIKYETGLLDILDGSGMTVSKALVRTDIPNLRVLPAGKCHERATELLASEQMAKLMEQFSTRYKDRVVIFDSPPLLLASESAVLAEMMGQILMVVAADQTPRYAVNDALSRLNQDKIIGLLLNKYRPTFGNKFGAGYGYGYGYGYGNHAAETGVDSDSIAKSP